MNRRGLRFSAGLAVASAVVCTGLVAHGGTARADTALIGWTAQSDANTVDLVVDNSAGLNGVHPLDEIDIPEDSSDYETGPLGYALATIFWPGAVGGNLGSLSGELSLPTQLASVMGKLNDSAKAESFYPAGPTTATFPNGASSNGLVEMTSQATNSESSAKAGLTDVDVPGLFDLQDVQGSTKATADTTANSTATGSFHSLSLLGGLVQIGATESTAAATSDGTSPSGTASTDLGAISIAGHSASIGSGGLVVGPASGNLSSLLDIPATLVDQVLSAIDFNVQELPKNQTSTAPAEEITSGGLSISFALPSDVSVNLDCTSLPSELYQQLGILCDAPQDLQGLKFTFTIGRVTAAAIASQPFAEALGNSSGSAPMTATTTDQQDGGVLLPSLDGGVLPTGPSAAVGAGPSAAGTPSQAPGLLPISLSSPVTVGVVLGLLALAAVIGLGLRRLISRLGVAASPVGCPLEEGPTR